MLGIYVTMVAARCLGADSAVKIVGHQAFITPQFLDAADTRAFRLPASTIRWTPGGWSGGEPALAPAPISSFDVLDVSVFRPAADGFRQIFPS